METPRETTIRDEGKICEINDIEFVSNAKRPYSGQQTPGQDQDDIKTPDLMTPRDETWEQWEVVQVEGSIPGE